MAIQLNLNQNAEFINGIPRSIPLLCATDRAIDRSKFLNVVSTDKKVQRVRAAWIAGIGGGLVGLGSVALLFIFPPIGVPATIASVSAATLGTATVTGVTYRVAIATEKLVDYLMNDLSEHLWFRERYKKTSSCLELIKAVGNLVDVKKQFATFIDSTPEMQQFFTMIVLESIEVPYELSVDAEYGVDYDKNAVEEYIQKKIADKNPPAEIEEINEQAENIEDQTGVDSKQEELCKGALYFEMLTTVLGITGEQIENKPPKNLYVKEVMNALFVDVYKRIPEELKRAQSYLARRILESRPQEVLVNENFMRDILRGQDVKQLTRLIDFTGVIGRHWPVCPPVLDWAEKIAANDRYTKHQLDLLFEDFYIFFESGDIESLLNAFLTPLTCLRAPPSGPDYVWLHHSTGIERYSHFLHGVVSPYTCALLSNLPYLEEKERVFPKGWELLNKAEPNNNAYYGLALRRGDVIVISHRGTEFNYFENIFADVILAAASGFEDKSRAPFKGLFMDALAFSNTIRIGNQNPRYTFIETGHSLGGACAELIAYIFDGKAITYDSPGTHKLLSDEKFRQAWRELAHRELKIPLPAIPENLSEEKYISFISSPNIVNTMGGHIGNVYRLYTFHTSKNGSKITDLGDSLATLFTQGMLKVAKVVTLGFFTQVLERESFSHSLTHIISCFDPVSGEPWLQRRVISWPDTTQYCGLFREMGQWEYLLTRICNDLKDANFAYERLIHNMPGYAVGDFVVPNFDDLEDHRRASNFAGGVLLAFDTFYKGFMFKRRLVDVITNVQHVAV